jgi:hypothetical protein
MMPKFKKEGYNMNIKTCCGCPDGKEIIYCGCECHKLRGNGIDYELVEPDEARETFQDDNEGLLFGINWLDEDGNILDCEWFATDEERQECLDRWYADTQDTTPEQ